MRKLFRFIMLILICATYIQAKDLASMNKFLRDENLFYKFHHGLKPRSPYEVH